MILEWALYSLSTIIFIWIFFFTGKTFRKYLYPYRANRLFQNFFYDTLFGSILVILLFSVVRTGFSTVNVTFLVPFTIMLLIKRKQEDPKYSYSSRDLARVAFYVAFMAVSIVTFSIFLKYNTGLDDDVVFYSNIASALFTTGKENTFHYYNETLVRSGNAPYHYFELWVGALFNAVSGGNLVPVLAMKYGGYPVLKVMVATGLISIFEHFRKPRVMSLIASVVLPLLSFYFITELGDNPWIIYGNMWAKPNLVTYYLFLIPVLYTLLIKDLDYFPVFLSFLPIVSITTAPAILSGYCLMVVLLLVFEKIRRPGLISLLTPVLTALFILIFYLVTGRGNTQINIGGESLTSVLLNFWQNSWKAIIYLTSLISLRAFLLFLVGVVLISAISGLRTIRDNIGFFAFPLLVVFPGILLFQLVAVLDNAYQFPYVGYSAIHLLIITGLYVAYKNLRIRLAKIALIIFTGLLMYVSLKRLNINQDVFRVSSLSELNLVQRNVDIDFTDRLKARIKDREASFGFIHTPEHLAGIRLANRLPIISPFGNHLHYLAPHVRLFPLNNPGDYYEGHEGTYHYGKIRNFFLLLNPYGVSCDPEATANFKRITLTGVLVSPGGVTEEYCFTSYDKISGVKEGTVHLASGDKTIIYLIKDRNKL